MANEPPELDQLCERKEQAWRAYLEALGTWLDAPERRSGKVQLAFDASADAYIAAVNAWRSSSITPGGGSPRPDSDARRGRPATARTGGR